MRIKYDSKKLMYQISLMSGYSIEMIKEFFESLITIIILDYIEKKSTCIPFLGKIEINYKGDKIKKGGKQAIIELTFKASDYILRNIGQIEDKDLCDIENLLMKKIRLNLEKIIEE